jgi:hypothetical protein
MLMNVEEGPGGAKSLQDVVLRPHRRTVRRPFCLPILRFIQVAGCTMKERATPHSRAQAPAIPDAAWLILVSVQK